MSVPEEAMEATEVVGASKFTSVDYVLFSIMLLVSIGIGVYSAIKSRGRESTQEFLLGGQAMSPFPVTLSLLGGVFSAISILGNPTEVYFFGFQIIMTLIGVIPGSLVVQHFLLPVFYNLKILSLNQYVEMRYKSRTMRKLATMSHLLCKFFYMGICLYAPSLALSTVTGLSVWMSMLSMGIVCTFYITIGGVKAVVYTDVVQTLLMFGGMLAVVIICCVNAGLDKIWTMSLEGARTEVFNMDTSPYVRHTFWSTVILGFYMVIRVIGFDQVGYQRFASVGSLQIAQNLCTRFAMGMIVLWGLFYFSGLVAYGVYHDCDPLTSGRIEKPDQILPFLVMDKLIHLTGLPGLFVAAVYGGVLSSLSSSGNSIACLIWEDFLQELPYFSKLSDKAATAVLKGLSFVAGASGILLGMLAGQLGNVFHVALSVISYIMGPIEGVFVAGICFPWVTKKGILVGFLTSFVCNMWVMIGKFMRGGGSPKRLPLSTLGCPENLINMTSTSITAFLNSTSMHDDHHTTVLPQSLLSDTTLAEGLLANMTQSAEEEGKTLYDVSYCYAGVIGILITVIVSSVVSFCTGPLRPGEVDARLVSPTCARLYMWLWKFFTCQRGSLEDKKIDKEATLVILPKTTTMDISMPKLKTVNEQTEYFLPTEKEKVSY